MPEERDLCVQVKCIMCGNTYELSVRWEDYDEFISPNRERHVQDIFPYLTAPERELLISRVCDTCWHKLWES